MAVINSVKTTLKGRAARIDVHYNKRSGKKTSVVTDLKTKRSQKVRSMAPNRWKTFKWNRSITKAKSKSARRKRTGKKRTTTKH